MNQATWDLLKPILAQAARDFLRTLGVALAARGFIQGDAGVATFVGAGMALAGLFWGWFTTTGYLKVASLLKKLTDTHSQAAAVVVAKQMAPAAVSGIAVDAKADIAAITKVVPVILLAFIIMSMAWTQPTFAKTIVQDIAAKKGLAVTGNPVRDLQTDLSNAGVKVPTIAPGSTGCDFNLFAALDPKNVVTQIQNCVSAVNNLFLPDVQAALDSAVAYKDDTATQCLTPALAIVKAAVGTPGDPTATPPVPAVLPGAILIFQKFREFTLAGGPTACQNWVKTTINGVNPL